MKSSGYLSAIFFPFASSDAVGCALYPIRSTFCRYVPVGIPRLEPDRLELRLNVRDGFVLSGSPGRAPFHGVGGLGL
jgi:hypothetical protein